MRYIILILCLVQFKVQASDWLNRTIRVDLIVNRRAFDPQYDLFQRSERISSGVNATNGRYPWTIFTTAWSEQQSGFRIGISCAGTIISSNFVLSDLHCVGANVFPPVNSIETFDGSVQLNSQSTATNFVRHYWYITPSPENSPNIVLIRLHETLTFNPNIKPIQLPSNDNFSYDAWSSFILGFQTPNGEFSAQMQSASTRILNNTLCNFSGSIADHEICGTEDSGPYEYGSIIRFNAFTGGAWIVYEYTADYQFHPIVIGIHEYQYANQTGSFGRATRVSPFVDWIEALTLDSVK